MLAKLLRHPSVNRTLVFSASTALISGGVVLTAAPSSAAACASFSGGGDGSSAAQAIHISTAADLNLLQATSSCWASGIYFQQQEDIDMGNAVWSSGIGRQEVRAFAGTYDGNGKSVGGLTVRSSDLYVGLFGYVTGSIDSLGFTGDVEGTRAQSGGGPYIGGLVGTATGPVSNSFSTGNVTCDAGSGQYQCFAGGLVGLNGSAITSSYSTGVVTTSYARDASAGGLVGTMSVGSISDSYSLATVQDAAGSARMMLGGLVGNTQSGISISRTYATGPVRDFSGTAYVGGLLGRDGGVTLADTYWDSDIALTDATACVGYTGTDPSGCTAATDDELKTLGTFSGFSIAEDYDASYTWGICSAVNDGYPFLTAFYTSSPCSSPSPMPSSGGSAAPPMTFSYYLPDGQQCTSISPQVVVNRTRVRLPGADAECRTPGATISGWRIAGQDWAFTPGYSVYVVASQRFTAVLNEPTATIVLDANVKAADACIVEVDGRADDVAPADRTQILHLDRPDMDEYPEGERPSLATYPAPTIAPCIPPGYSLVSWNTRGDGSGITVETGSPFDLAINEDDPNSDRNTVRFYAMWEEQQGFVSTSASAFFADTSAEFTQSGFAKLNSLVAAIPSRATTVTVHVIGSSVSLETLKANQDLAKQRADALARETRSLGITGDFAVTTANTAMRDWLIGQPVPAPQGASDPQVSADGKPLSTVIITYESR